MCFTLSSMRLEAGAVVKQRCHASHDKACWMQAQLREKEKQLKGLASELSMEQAGVEEHRDSVTRLQRELMDMKRLWLEAKRQVRSGNPLTPCNKLRRSRSCAGHVGNLPSRTSWSTKTAVSITVMLLCSVRSEHPGCDATRDGALKSFPHSKGNVDFLALTL